MALYYNLGKKLLNSLKNIFISSASDEKDLSDLDELNLFCGMLVEAASIDGTIHNEEIDKIKTSLVEIFEENEENIEKTLEECLKKANQPNSIYFYTSKINKSFDEAKKINLLEVLWQIVLADGKIHDFESNLIRRLAGLLYISDVNCGNAKKNALNKIKKQ